MNFIRNRLTILFCLAVFTTHAQEVEMIYSPNIYTVQLHQLGNQAGIPIYKLNSTDRIQLGFDDIDSRVRNYYYTYVLCDYNWQPVNLNTLDYIKGFTQNRISTYRNSSIALTRYTHYQVILPELNASVPIRSGNYLLKVFLDGDTAKKVFTKRMYVVEQKASIAAAIVQPLNPRFFTTHQKIKFNANIKGINSFSAAQQVRAVILQNNRWDNAQVNIPPTFVRGNSLEFNSENIGIFDAGKEWRWLDIRSFSLQSDRVETAKYNKTSTDIYLKPDIDRSAQRYIYFQDYNGMFNISTYETINPMWQGDYASVYFSFLPPKGVPYPNTDIYLSGAFTGYDLSERWKMVFNEEKKVYETAAFLKQGTYDYSYIVKNPQMPGYSPSLEGSSWETENSYTIFLYYKSFTDRSDQLIGVSQINSHNDRPGLSY